MKPGEMRSETRLAEEMNIQVLAYSTPDGKQDPNQFKITRTIDISAGGMQIEVNGRIPVKSVLKLRLQSRGRPKPFTLAGEVRWIYQDKLDARRFYIGFRLSQDDDTDNDTWRDYVNDRLSMAKR